MSVSPTLIPRVDTSPVFRPYLKVKVTRYILSLLLKESPGHEADHIHDMMSSFTKAIEHLENAPIHPPAPRPSPTLLTLPQEIQDCIFELAYPKIPNLQYITKRQWESEEQERRKADRKTFQARPFPEPKVCSFFVSKEYFVAAARSYVGDQTIDLNHETIVAEVYSKEPNGILHAFTTTASLLALVLGFPSMPPNLKNLTMTITPQNFDMLDEMYVWLDDLNEADMETIMTYHDWHHLIGLRQLCLVPHRCYYADTPGKVGKWEENVRRLETFMRQRVCRPKEVSSDCHSDNRSGTSTSVSRL